MIDQGIDPKNFLNDFLEIIYLFSRRINLGIVKKDLNISDEDNELINKYSKNIDMQDIGLFWQLTLKTIDDLKMIGNENLLLEMFVMQLVHLKNIDNNKETTKDIDVIEQKIENRNLIQDDIKKEKSENDLTNNIKSQLKNTNQIKKNLAKNFIPQNESNKIEINSFKDLIDKANYEKEVELKFDLERNVKLVNFNKGKIEISFNEKLNQNFIKNLTEKLLVWTGDRWIISLSRNNIAKSFYEKNIEKKTSNLENFKKSELGIKIKNAFSDVEVIDVKEVKDE